MKPSNILLLSFFGSITLTIVAGAFDVRLNGSKDGYTHYDQEIISLNAFSCLTVDGVHKRITVEASPEFSIGIYTLEGDPMPSVSYHIKGDSLYIEGFDHHGHGAAHLKIQLPQNALKRLHVRNKSEIFINDYSFQDLSLDVDNSRVDIHNREKGHAAFLAATGSNGSNISVIAYDLDTLDIRLNESNITVSNQVGLLKGTMYNKSLISVREVNHFEFRKDASSRLQHWE